MASAGDSDRRMSLSQRVFCLAEGVRMDMAGGVTQEDNRRISVSDC